ncbi:MAG: hypothetical protein QN187_01395 [Armatimonadota bacterium]|nr:hypothetical protein [Armatimonadota bacterium]MDR7520504.1 hypothetical protein [Armatimonadota bacterium]MDR7550215.1 hypothetical protein [Armatimonadota bacterium]
MHPIGIALAFLVFWSFVAVGVFMLVSSGRRMRQARNAFWALVSGAVMLLGVALTGAGLYATFVVLYGR